MDYLIIIPAYNEEEVIGDVLKGISKIEPDMDILVVNDCSKDRTSEIAQLFVPRSLIFLITSDIEV